ncbi:ParB family protein, partial [Staphylococcus aureus]|uniref:ParB family protein n=2 Tax=Bacillati TaxID=1783272 RepID=UPI00321B7603
MTPVPAQGKTEQLHFFVKPENAARYRAAFLATQHLDGEEAQSLTDFLERAVLRETRRLERKH